MFRGKGSWIILSVAAVALVVAGAVLVSACRRDGAAASAKGSAVTKSWHCAMHPQVVSDKPGTCPICHMDLVPMEGKVERAPPSTGGTIASGHKVLYWFDPMVPGSKFDKPGKSPLMDMQLVPKYADEVSGASESAVKVGLSPEAVRATGIAVVSVEK